MTKKRSPRRRPTDPPRPLKPGELRTGAIDCFDNARDLFGEARLLLSHGHNARACALAAVGFEELSKARVCAGLLAKSPDFAEFEDSGAFYHFWVNHAAKGTQVFKRTADDRKEVWRPPDFESVKGLAKALRQTRERGLYVDVRDSRPPERPGRTTLEPLSGTWPARFVHPRTLDARAAQSILEHLSVYIGDLTPRIESLRAARAAEGKKFAAALIERWDQVKQRPVRVVSDFPAKPGRDFEVVVYGSNYPHLLRALRAHYGVPVKGRNVEPGKAERTLEQVLGDLDAEGRELLVRGPGNVVIEAVVSTDRKNIPVTPARYGLAFYEQPKGATR